MKNKRSKKEYLKNEKGIITISFLFVLILSLAFLLSFFGLCLTLATGSITQYLTYSTARKLSLSDISFSEQESQAQEQYQILRSKIFNNPGTWFNIPDQAELGMNQEYEDDPQARRQMFYGAWVLFSSTLSNFQIPFLSDEKGGNLETIIGAYLGKRTKPTRV